MSGESAARPLRRAERAALVTPENLGGLGNGETEWLDHFHPDELSRMGRACHAYHGFISFQW